MVLNLLPTILNIRNLFSNFNISGGISVNPIQLKLIVKSLNSSSGSLNKFSSPFFLCRFFSFNVFSCFLCLALKSTFPNASDANITSLQRSLIIFKNLCFGINTSPATPIPTNSTDGGGPDFSTLNLRRNSYKMEAVPPSQSNLLLSAS